MSKEKKSQGEMFGPPNPFIIRNVKAPNEDYHKPETLTEWLRLKHKMSYKTYHRESEFEREEYRIEYILDTVFFCQNFLQEKKVPLSTRMLWSYMQIEVYRLHTASLSASAETISIYKESEERKGVYCFHECVGVYIFWFGQVFCQSREVAHPGKGPFPPLNRRRLNRRYFWYVLFSPQDAAPPLQIWSSCDSAPTNSFNHVFVCQRQQITIR